MLIDVRRAGIVAAVALSVISLLGCKHVAGVKPSVHLSPPWFPAHLQGTNEFLVAFPADTNGTTMTSIVFSVDTGELECRKEDCDMGYKLACQDIIEIKGLAPQKTFLNTFGQPYPALVQRTQDNNQDDGEKFTYYTNNPEFSAAQAILAGGSLTVKIHPSVPNKYDGHHGHASPYSLYYVLVSVTHDPVQTNKWSGSRR